MAALRPIHWRKFEKFLFRIGCAFARQEGDHRSYRRPGLKRPIIVRVLKDIPIFEIRANLRTLGMTVEEYLRILDES